MEQPLQTETTRTPTRKPVFTDTMQIGMIVRDLNATVERFIEDYGIGPWTIFEVTPEIAPNLRHDGGPVRGSCRSAVAMVGKVMWELTEPLDDLTLFARFLAEKGEGVHHIAVATPNFEEVVAEHTADGTVLPLSGSLAGIDVAYLPTDRALGGVLLEVFSGMPGGVQDSGAANEAQ